MKIKIEITETLQRTVEVDAEDMDDALYKVKKMYYKEDIMLDSSDYIDTEFMMVE